MAPREFSLDSNIRRSRPSLPLPILPADVGYGRRSKQAAASAKSKRDGGRNGASRGTDNGGDGVQARGRSMDRRGIVSNSSTASPPSNNGAPSEDSKTCSQSRRSSTCSPITEEPQSGQRGSSNDLEGLGGSSSTASESRNDDEFSTSESSDGLSSAFSAGLDAMGRKSNVTTSTELDLWNQINSVPLPSSSPTVSPSGANNVSLNDIAKSSRSLTVYEQSDRELNDQYVMGKIKQLHLPASFHSSSEELSHLPENGRDKIDNFGPRQAATAAYKRPRKVEAITEDDEEYARAPTDVHHVSTKKTWQGDDVNVKPDFNPKLSSITIDPDIRGTFKACDINGNTDKLKDRDSHARDARSSRRPHSHYIGTDDKHDDLHTRGADESTMSSRVAQSYQPTSKSVVSELSFGVDLLKYGDTEEDVFGYEDLFDEEEYNLDAETEPGMLNMKSLTSLKSGMSELTSSLTDRHVDEMMNLKASTFSDGSGEGAVARRVNPPGGGINRYAREMSNGERDEQRVTNAIHAALTGSLPTTADTRVISARRRLLRAIDSAFAEYWDEVGQIDSYR